MLLLSACRQRGPLVLLVARMHPFVTALFGMSSLSQVDPLFHVSRLSLSVCYSTRPPRTPVAHHATGEPTPRSPLSCGRHRTPTPTLLAMAGLRAAPATQQTQEHGQRAPHLHLHRPVCAPPRRLPRRLPSSRLLVRDISQRRDRTPIGGCPSYAHAFLRPEACSVDLAVSDTTSGQLNITNG